MDDTYEYACKVGAAASRLMALRKGMTVDEYESKRRRWDPPLTEAWNRADRVLHRAVAYLNKLEAKP